MNYLSLGAGVQSTALLIMAHEHPEWAIDYSIFADTQCEPSYVYEHLETLKKWSKIPIIVCTRGNLEQDTLDGAAGKRKGIRNSPLPVYVERAGVRGILRRGCTIDYKIQPILKTVKELVGYKPRMKNPPRVNCYIGISFDERRRMKASLEPWITNVYPLVDMNVPRSECEKIIERAGMKVPHKSACYFCPFHDNRHWRWLRDNYPKEFEKAVKFDLAIRDLSALGVRQEAYLNDDLEPLGEVDLEDPYKDQMDMFKTECTGMCGV